MSEQLTREELKTLAADTRLHIVKMLAQRPHTQSELAKKLGKHITTVAEHAELLEKNGFVERKDDGHKWIYYRLSRKGEKLFQPRFYSWTFMLALSVISIMLGGAVLLPSYDDYYGYEKAAETVSYIQASSVPQSQSIVDISIIISLVLITVGIIGLCISIIKKGKEKSLLIKKLV
jgi:DNA-binding transcriptional ArsR family regulator